MVPFPANDDGDLGVVIRETTNCAAQTGELLVENLVELTLMNIISNVSRTGKDGRTSETPSRKTNIRLGRVFILAW